MVSSLFSSKLIFKIQVMVLSSMPSLVVLDAGTCVLPSIFHTTRTGVFLPLGLEESHSHETLSGDSGRFGLQEDGEDNDKR